MVEFAVGMVNAERARDSAAAVAYFEALLIHLRNLIEFLLCSPVADRFAPEDFGAVWDRSKQQPERDDLLKVANHDIQVHLADLLWRGVKKPVQPDGPWDPLPHVRAMAAVFRRICASLPENNPDRFACTLHAVDAQLGRLNALTAPTGPVSESTSGTKTDVWSDSDRSL